MLRLEDSPKHLPIKCHTSRRRFHNDRHQLRASDSRASFLCPNSTVFAQDKFVCDWWFNVGPGAAQHRGHPRSGQVGQLDLRNVTGDLAPCWQTSPAVSGCTTWSWKRRPRQAEGSTPRVSLALSIAPGHHLLADIDNAVDVFMLDVGLKPNKGPCVSFLPASPQLVRCAASSQTRIKRGRMTLRT